MLEIDRLRLSGEMPGNRSKESTTKTRRFFFFFPRALRRLLVRRAEREISVPIATTGRRSLTGSSATRECSTLGGGDHPAPSLVERRRDVTSVPVSIKVTEAYAGVFILCLSRSSGVLSARARELVDIRTSSSAARTFFFIEREEYNALWITGLCECLVNVVVRSGGSSSVGNGDGASHVKQQPRFGYDGAEASRPAVRFAQGGRQLSDALHGRDSMQESDESHQASHERFHGVEPDRTQEDLRTAARHAQRGDQQAIGATLEDAVGSGTQAVHRRSRKAQASPHAGVPGLQVPTAQEGQALRQGDGASERFVSEQ